MGARVFIALENDKFDVGSATEYGEVEYLMSKNRGDHVSPFVTDKFTKAIGKALSDNKFNPDVDYIAMTGPTINVGVLLGLALAKHRKLRVLLFDAGSSTYVERSVKVE